MKLKNTILLLSTFACSQVAAEGLWSDIALNDLQNIYQTAKSDHPGFVDEQNPEFRQWLEKGYQQALVDARQANSLQDVMTVLKTYVAGFADGHFGLRFDYQPRTYTWAGVRVGRYGNEYRVNFVDESHSPSLPQVGDKLLSCDTRSVDDIMAQDVLAYRFNAPELNFPKVWHASRLLVDDGLGERNHFTSCNFERDGNSHSYDLSWRSIAYSDYIENVPEVTTKREFAMTSVLSDGYWVSLPSFHPDEQGQQALNDVIAQVRKVQGSAKVFVIDVRGNTGGSSQWGIEVAKAIYGSEYIEQSQLLHSDTGYALWRASEGNADFLKNAILPFIRQSFGTDNEFYGEFSALHTRLEDAMRDGNALVRQSQKEEASETLKVPEKLPEPTSKVLFLTDASCGSACLDFADLLLKLPNVTHVGQETGADTVYMEVRPVDLPSGLGRYSLAQKVYRDRARKHNESYVPEHFYAGDMEDTENLKKWIEELPVVKQK